MAKKWNRILNVCREVYWLELRSIDKPRANRWNDLVDEIRPVVDALVRRKTAAIVAAARLPEAFVRHVQWDFLMLAMEGEYLDLHPGGLYRAMSTPYYRGHFPCGWEGEEPPTGRFIVH